MRRRLQDQVLILEAIGEVREELIRATGYAQVMVAVRLSTLYALLDIDSLKTLVKQTDSRNGTRLIPKKEAA